jgi:hypothetical protein
MSEYARLISRIFVPVGPKVSSPFFKRVLSLGFSLNKSTNKEEQVAFQSNHLQIKEIQYVFE